MSSTTSKPRVSVSNAQILAAQTETNTLLRDLVAALTAREAQHSTPAPVVEAVKASKPSVQHATSTRTMIEYRKDHSGQVKTCTQAQFNVRKQKAESLGHTLTVLRTYEEAKQGAPKARTSKASTTTQQGTGTCQGCGKGGLISNTHCKKCRSGK